MIENEARTIADVAAKVRFLGQWEPFAEMDIERPEDMGVVKSAYVSLLLDVYRLAGKSGAA